MSPFEDVAREGPSRALDEAGWLEARRSVVTASESAHLLGLYASAPFGMTAPELAERKRSTAPPRVSEHAHAGRWWEDPNLSWFSKVSGACVVGLDRLYISREHPFMAATPDGIVSALDEHDEDLLPFLHFADEFDLLQGREARDALIECIGKYERVLVEAKHQRSKSRFRWNKPGKLGAGYECQARHQAVVCGADLVLVVAKVDANELYVHPVYRTADYEEALVEACRLFSEKYLSFSG